MQKIIGVFDSGVGGMTTAAEIQKVLPEAKLLYYGDRENCPYGEKSQAELVEITTKIVRNFQKQSAELVVIACNTATTQCIHDLRERFPDLTFVGTEPAIKVACDSGCKNILLLATPGTVRSAQVERLVDKYIATQKITLLPCPGLAELVEKSTTVTNGLANFQMMREISMKLEELLNGITERSKIDAVVLGCTHYIYLKSEIQKYFPNAQLIDGNSGVARRVKAFLK